MYLIIMSILFHSYANYSIVTSQLLRPKGSFHADLPFYFCDCRKSFYIFNLTFDFKHSRNITSVCLVLVLVLGLWFNYSRWLLLLRTKIESEVSHASVSGSVIGLESGVCTLRTSIPYKFFCPFFFL